MDLIVSSANAGICVEPENPDKLSKTILEYKEKNNKKTDAGRKYVINYASKESCIDKYIDILEREVKRCVKSDK